MCKSVLPNGNAGFSNNARFNKRKYFSYGLAQAGFSLSEDWDDLTKYECDVAGSSNMARRMGDGVQDRTEDCGIENLSDERNQFLFYGRPLGRDD